MAPARVETLPMETGPNSDVYCYSFLQIQLSHLPLASLTRVLIALRARE